MHISLSIYTLQTFSTLCNAMQAQEAWTFAHASKLLIFEVASCVKKSNTLQKRGRGRKWHWPCCHEVLEKPFQGSSGVLGHQLAVHGEFEPGEWQSPSLSFPKSENIAHIAASGPCATRGTTSVKRKGARPDLEGAGRSLLRSE